MSAYDLRCRSAKGSFQDGPRPGKPPSTALLAGAVIIGGLLAARGTPISGLAVFAVLIVSLVACWYSDVRCGIVPDYFTLVPLVLVLGLALVDHDFLPIVAAIVVSLPFAGAALLSKGRGMGWGDVKLVALGGAVLGLQTSVLAFSAACLLAVVITVLRRRRDEPVAFVPYLAGSIAVAVSFPRLS
jgi:leader peptidase (prepilin peptidase)/N-methyltransferase